MRTLCVPLLLRLAALYDSHNPLLTRAVCNLVKNIVLTGFGDITLLDLDTIDLSNLNRQFLFRKKDIKQSKALVCLLDYRPQNEKTKTDPCVL